jgi:type IV pilus assembly protein PilV
MIAQFQPNPIKDNRADMSIHKVLRYQPNKFANMPSKKLASSQPRSQKGSSLLEVMIAGFLFMIGLLGLLATQGLAMKLSNSSVLYTNATILVSELYDRIKANPTAMQSGAYSTSAYNAANWSSAKDCSNTSLTCTPGEQATYDLSRWKATLQSQFPAGALAKIARTAVNDSQYTVQLIWSERVENDADGDGQEDVVTSNCANGDNRRANEKAVCAILDFGGMGEF